MIALVAIEPFRQKVRNRQRRPYVPGVAAKARDVIVPESGTHAIGHDKRTGDGKMGTDVMITLPLKFIDISRSLVSHVSLPPAILRRRGKEGVCNGKMKRFQRQQVIGKTDCCVCCGCYLPEGFGMVCRQCMKRVM